LCIKLLVNAPKLQESPSFKTLDSRQKGKPYYIEETCHQQVNGPNRDVRRRKNKSFTNENEKV